jgi:hypothetical protein
MTKSRTKLTMNRNDRMFVRTSLAIIVFSMGHLTS